MSTRRFVLLMLAITQPLMLTIMASPDHEDQQQCVFSKDCCVEDCCGRGTRWDSRVAKCVQDPSSEGFTGVHSDDYDPDCETAYTCCEGDCCGILTYYDPFYAFCIGLRPPTPSPSASPTTVLMEEDECNADCPCCTNPGRPEFVNAVKNYAASPSRDDSCFRKEDSTKDNNIALISCDPSRNVAYMSYTYDDASGGDAVAYCGDSDTEGPPTYLTDAEAAACEAVIASKIQSEGASCSSVVFGNC